MLPKLNMIDIEKIDLISNQQIKISNILHNGNATSSTRIHTAHTQKSFQIQIRHWNLGNFHN